jgi:hypothetical protein
MLYATAPMTLHWKAAEAHLRRSLASFFASSRATGALGGSVYDTDASSTSSPSLVDDSTTGMPRSSNRELALALERERSNASKFSKSVSLISLATTVRRSTANAGGDDARITIDAASAVAARRRFVVVASSTRTTSTSSAPLAFADKTTRRSRGAFLSPARPRAGAFAREPTALDVATHPRVDMTADDGTGHRKEASSDVTTS